MKAEVPKEEEAHRQPLRHRPAAGAQRLLPHDHGRPLRQGYVSKLVS